MIVKNALTQIIRPALAELSPPLQGAGAEVMLLAIGLQESRLIHRKQIQGPARGLWQFERAGVQGVLTHPASRALAADLCPPSPASWLACCSSQTRARSLLSAK